MVTYNAGMASVPPVIALDYPGHRVGSRLTDLQLEQQGHTVVDVLYDPLPRVPDARQYAEQLLPRCPRREVTAVLGYCLAGPIAHELAKLLVGVRDDPVGLILFDCRPAEPEVIEAAYLAALARLGATRSGITRQDAAQAGGPAVAVLRAGGSPVAVVDAMKRELLTYAANALLDEGEDPDERTRAAGEELADHHLRWFVHLLAALNATLPAWGGDVLHVVSGEHTYETDWPGARTTTTVRIRCPRDELLSDSQARAAVLLWLQERR